MLFKNMPFLFLGPDAPWEAGRRKKLPSGRVEKWVSRSRGEAHDNLYWSVGPRIERDDRGYEDDLGWMASCAFPRGVRCVPLRLAFCVHVLGVYCTVHVWSGCVGPVDDLAAQRIAVLGKGKKGLYEEGDGGMTCRWGSAWLGCWDGG